MLCLTRRNGQAIRIGDAKVTVVKSRTGSCKFGIDAPRDMTIVRDELPEETTDEEAMRLANRQPCETLPAWLRENLGPRCLAPLTGQDFAALAAAVQIVQVYAHDGRREILEAFGTVVRSMQRSCQPFAYHAIAHVLNWSDRDNVWSAAGLEWMSFGKCKCEP